MITAKTAALLTKAAFKEHRAAEVEAKLVVLDQRINAAVCQGEQFLRVDYDEHNLAELHAELKALGYRLSDQKRRGRPHSLTIAWSHLMGEV